MNKIWISVTVNHDTGNALLVDHGLGPEEWIPRAMILDYSDEFDVGDMIEIKVTESFAQEKGMI